MTLTISTQSMSKRPLHKDLDVINIALMVFSGLVAFLAPFEVFLFAYAFLGPLHYLTEIGWLNQRKYFTTQKADPLVFLILGLATTGIVWKWTFIIRSTRLYEIADHAVGISLFLAAAFVLGKSWPVRIPAIAVALFAAYKIRGWDSYRFWVLTLVPTILHVYVFTLAFVIFGALKRKSKIGYLSAVVMTIMGAAMLLLPVVANKAPSTGAIDAYNGFVGLNSTVLTHFGHIGLDPFTSPTAIALMRFIAFAYTYHYLNWFSKTKVINWHHISRTQATLVVVLWLGSVGIYLNDYARGLKVLFTLSFVHVLLEFPLNLRTFSGIGAQLWARRHRSIS